MNIRQIAPAAALATVMVGAAAPAMATPVYPPSTPSATQSSTEVLGQSATQGTGSTEVLGSRLALTGSEVGLAGGIGAVLVLAGAGAVVVARKRSAAQQ